MSTSPNALHIHDPFTNTESVVPLQILPTAVSVAPDGMHAAVGHNGWITYVDLASAAVVSTLSVTTNALDVVLAGNDYAYVFPKQDQWEEIHCVNISTGLETLSQGWSIYGGTVAKLHPNGTTIYGADNGLSPSDIERYGITSGTAQYLYLQGVG